jgi:hypothetical protein
MVLACLLTEIKLGKLWSPALRDAPRNSETLASHTIRMLLVTITIGNVINYMKAIN